MLLFLVSAVSALPIDTAAAATEPQPSTSVVSATQLGGFKVTGPLAPSSDVYVTVGIPLRNLQYLQFLTEQISTPGSSMYRDFLTPSAIEQDFLPVTQYQQAVSFLEAHGLTIIIGSLDSIIVAQGTAAQAASALGVTYDVFSNGSMSYYSASGVSPLAGDYVYSSNATAVFFSHPTTLVKPVQVSSLASPDPDQTNQTYPISGFPITYLPTAYNVTSLYAKGITGAGYTAGVLDFGGAPYIQQELAYFDQIYGLPAANLKVIPIGPYDPGLGDYVGADDEIGLDVEAVHAMAPGASIDLYMGNLALPIAVALAPIVQSDQVNDLSQSFGYPEDVFSQGGASFFDLNVVLPDQYYMLGSLEGITFSAATGDEAGTGFAGSPEGTPLYPATSPYVTAAGGTQAYFDVNGTNVVSSYQTAWSSYGFVPDGINYGGTTGGVSNLEPKPWYQSSIATPSTFDDGRVIPDISLSAGYTPGIIVVLTGNLTYIIGGTSEASPLFAGLLTLLMQAGKTTFGLINPSLYALGESKALSAKVYTPVTFGYDTPWVASSGYNLLTGWGAPNIGEMAHYGLNAASRTSLAIDINATVGGVPAFEFKPDQTIAVDAAITNGASVVSSGTFTASLQSLQGATGGTTLTYDAKTGEWSGTVVAPNNASGLAFITVTGSSGETSGSGSSEVFIGYIAQFFSPFSDLSNFTPFPFSSAYGIPIDVNITNLDGVPISNFTYSATTFSYSVLTNTYTPVMTTTLAYGFSPYGEMWVGNLTGTLSEGPMQMTMNNGAWGSLPFINGVDLQASLEGGSVLTEPGAVAPGQSIFIIAEPEAPLNLPSVTSLETGLPVYYDVDFGSNVTATLVNQAGEPVASANLYLNSFLQTDFSSEPVTAIQGALQVPSGVAPGLYTIVLTSSFNSFTLSASVDGMFYGQIYVAGEDSLPQISTNPSLLFEGQTVTVSAHIAYGNGTSVKYGVYVAAVYPKGLETVYPLLTEEISIPLAYNVQTGLWSGNMTLPSEYNGGGTFYIDPGAVYPSGPYELIVSGVSADGVPTSTQSSAQQGITVQPYLWVSGQSFASPPQPTGVAFSGDTITSSVSLSNDLFLGNNTISGGTVTITDSQINGTLIVSNAHVTLVGVSGGDIVAKGSQVTLQESSVGSLQLSSSEVALNASTFARVSPPLPSVSVTSPAANQLFNGTTGSLTLNGQDVASLSVYLDGVLLTNTSAPSSPYTFQLPSSISDGVHLLQVVAKQKDGLSTVDSVYFSTNRQISAADEQISSANSQISTLTSQLSSASSTIGTLGTQLNAANGTIGSLKSGLSAANQTIGTLSSTVNSDGNKITTLTNTLYLMAAVAVVALVLAIVSLARKGGSGQQASSPPPTAGPGPSPEMPPSTPESQPPSSGDAPPTGQN